VGKLEVTVRRAGGHISQRRLEREFHELDAKSRRERLDDRDSLRLEKIIREMDYRAKRPKRVKRQTVNA
jgi:hypothetical protein